MAIDKKALERLRANASAETKDEGEQESAPVKATKPEKTTDKRAIFGVYARNTRKGDQQVFAAPKINGALQRTVRAGVRAVMGEMTGDTLTALRNTLASLPAKMTAAEILADLDAALEEFHALRQAVRPRKATADQDVAEAR